MGAARLQARAGCRPAAFRPRSARRRERFALQGARERFDDDQTTVHLGHALGGVHSKPDGLFRLVKIDDHARLDPAGAVKLKPSHFP
jgi:hypothetical protein